MKKQLFCLAAALSVVCAPLCAPGVTVCGAENPAVTAAEPVKDPEEIVSALNEICTENGMPADAMIAPADYAPYPEYAGRVVAEFHLTEAPGVEFSQMSDTLVHAAAERGIFKERYRIAVLVNGARPDPYDPDVPKAAKVLDGVWDAFAAGAQTVEVDISFTFDAGGISEWTHAQMLEYEKTLDPEQYSEYEILVMTGQYWEKLQLETLTAAREEAVADIVGALGADPETVDIYSDYAFFCVLTAEQAARADGAEAIRRVALWHTTIYPYQKIVGLPAALREMTERIIGWENTAPEQCYLIRSTAGWDHCVLMTPQKAYTIGTARYSPLCVYLQAGTAPDGADVLARWKEMLRAEGYPEQTLECFTCTVTPAENGGFYVSTSQDAYRTVSLTDCLVQLPQVRRITAQYAYYTEDRPNQASNFALRFRCSEALSAADFPELENVQISNTYAGDSGSADIWYLTFPEGGYAEMYAAMSVLCTKKSIREPWLIYGTTELADASEDAFVLEPEYRVLFERGDVNGNGDTNIADAVLLARFNAEDAAARVSADGKRNADLNADGAVDALDLAALLNLLAGLS